MGTERLPTRIAVEERRKNVERQSGRNEQRVLAERRKDDLSQLPGHGGAFRQLHIVLGAGGLMSGGDASIHPIRFIEKLAGILDLVTREQSWYGQKHRLKT